jgi:LacI family transcriptional regulator
LATIKDVAALSGVGVGTVSRVLNGGTNVNKETKKKVLAAIKQLNFTPNSMGVKLRKNQNKVFALLVPLINHSFFAELTAQVEKEALKHGYSILLVCSQKHEEREIEIINKLNRKEVDGVIFVTHYNHSEEELKNKVIVTIDRHLPGDIPFVSSNNYEASREAVSYLISKGCKKIAYLGSKPFVDSEVLLRLKAYSDVIRENNLEEIISSSVINHGEEQQYVLDFINNNPDIDGVFVSGSSMSRALYNALIKKGKKIPEDIQIISYDGYFGEWSEGNDITCVEQPIEEMAASCIKILLDLIKGEKPEKENIFKSKFVLNKTTK